MNGLLDSIDLDQLDMSLLDSTLASALARMEDERSSWREAMNDTTAVAK